MSWYKLWFHSAENVKLIGFRSNKKELVGPVSTKEPSSQITVQHVDRPKEMLSSYRGVLVRASRTLFCVAASKLKNWLLPEVTSAESVPVSRIIARLLDDT